MNTNAQAQGQARTSGSAGAAVPASLACRRAAHAAPELVINGRLSRPLTPATPELIGNEALESSAERGHAERGNAAGGRAERAANRGISPKLA